MHGNQKTAGNTAGRKKEGFHQHPGHLRDAVRPKGAVLQSQPNQQGSPRLTDREIEKPARIGSALYPLSDSGCS